MVKCLMSVLLLMIPCMVNAAAVSPGTQGEYLMFIGNPGVGKSAIINSLVGTRVAESGLSAGTGLTKFFSAYEHEGKQYFDTPGLEDIKLREQAAREIETALKKDGSYRLFFVITLESLRVKPADVTTINTVMSAIKSEYKKFNVIINKVTKLESKRLATKPEDLASVYEQINAGEHRTDSIWYIDRDRDVEDGEKDFINIDAKLREFVFTKSASITIAKENVHALKIDEFEKIREQFEETLSTLREEIKEGNKKYDAIIERMSDLQKTHQELKDDFKEQKEENEKMREDAKQATKDLAEAKRDAEVARKEAEMEADRRRMAEESSCTLL